MDDASRLCTSCGLCCNGSLFDYARVMEGEEETVRAAGLEIVAGEDGTLKFLQPCRYFEDSRCTRYETRFHICRSFTCELLNAMRKGAVAPADAMATVAEAKRLQAVVEARMGTPPTRRARRDKMRELEKRHPIPHGPRRGEDAALRLDLMALRLFLERHFRRSRAGRYEGDPSAESAVSLPARPQERSDR